MILREVREDEDVEANPVEAMQDRAVRRGFDGDALVARVEHLAKETLQIDRLGSRVRRRPSRPTDDPLDRPDEPGRAAGCLEHGPEQKGRRRLAVRARDPGDLERSRRLAEEEVGRDRHRHARIVDEKLRDVDLERLLDDERGCAGGDRRLREVMPVRARARNAEECRPRRDAVGAVGEVGDLDGSAGADLARREHARQVVEVHGVIVYGGPRTRLRARRR